MAIQWCVCDVDGTLLDSNSRLSEETVRAVQEMRQAGIELILATGRSDLFIKELVFRLGIAGPVICCNGGMIRDVGTGQVLFSRTIGRETARAVAEYCFTHRLDMLAYSYDFIYYSRGSDRVNLFHDFNARMPEEFRVPLREAARPEDLPLDSVLKFFLWNADAVLKENMEAWHNREGELYLVQSMQGALDIMAQGISKGDALRYLAGQRGMSLDQIAVFGDNYNDVSMFQLAGCPIAVGNAEAVVKEAAKYITRSNDENGVAYAIRHYILSPAE
ncbi:cof protein [Lucifera butyrica]|uniref:Cof protein n=1 Tax=Lucifera butyrica TaxID=1351585 RepID=A0A498RLA1_9FIRM|nr:HAD family hydrolase [Lucifera butyrica]VBB09838.1 cof protein [Lucifera butyrica]